MMLEKYLRWVVLAGIFALPFIVFLVAHSLFFPYITGKNFTFRVIVEIITGAWLALALTNPDYRPRRSWLLGALALFVVVIALADALGAYPFKSFWSNYERMDGWVTQAHLFLYFVVAYSVLKTEKLWTRLWQTSFAVSGVVALYGFLQLAGISAIGQGGGGGLGARLDATFGNPIYLAVYMLFHIFIGALLWSRAWHERGVGKRLPSSLFYGGIIAVNTMVLFLTGTRGTMIGLIGGTVLAAFLFAFSSQKQNVWRWVGAFLIGLALFAGGVWLVRDSAFVKQVGFLNRLATISLSESVIKSRFLNAGMAWEGFKERPILGWGQEHYALVFDKYYNPEMYNQEQWFDRVHNTVLDWLVAGGLLGLLSYLSIFAAAFVALWRGAAFGSTERSILSGLLVAYFFHNLFVFDNITSYTLFFSVLAYIAYRAGSHANASPIFALPAFRSLLPIAAAGAIVLVWAGAWFVNGNALAANRALLQAVAPQQEGIAKNLEYFKKAISYGTYGTQEAREQLIQGTAQLASADVPTELKNDFLQTAVREMEQQMQSSPLDARFPLFLGVLLDAYGDYESARIALERALSLSPAKQSILYELGSNQLARGKNADALATFKTAYELVPENTDAHVYYAAAAIRVGQDALANELLTPLIEKDAAADVRIAAAYVARKQYGPIVSIWEAHVKASPQDAQGYFTLAAAYFGAGNSARAIATLETVKSIIPSTKEQADSLITEIRNGTAQI